MFFIGDHPAQQLERGTQQGGKYKCGGCGVKDVMIGDLAHTLLRSLEDQQKLAIAGKFGKQPSKPKPFYNLQLREELHARGDYEIGMLKDELKEKLEELLCRVQWVPTLTFQARRSSIQFEFAALHSTRV